MKLTAHFKAALIALHLVAITLQAMPAPVGAMRKAEWKDATVQDELAVWTHRLNGWGVSWTQQELEDHAWTVAGKWLATRRTVLEPFAPYYRYCGTHQSWRMFVAPHRYPSRLHIDIRTGSEWTPVYVGRDPELDWHAGWLDHDRMRSVVFRFGWKSYRRSYRQFADFMAGHAAVEFPDATHVRLRMYKQRTPSPEEVRLGELPEGKFHSVRVLPLEPIRERTP